MPLSNQKYLYLSQNLKQHPMQMPIVLQTTNNTGNMADREITHRTHSLYGAFNLGLHVKDNPQQVHQHRATLLADIQAHYPHIEQIRWLQQVHGDTITTIGETLPIQVIAADAQITQVHSVALAIMTADCVPIMLAHVPSGQIAAIHAGWQGLAKGIIGKTVTKMREQISPANTQDKNTHVKHTETNETNEWQAWIGASIAVTAYEVDERVREQVLAGMAITDDDLSATFFIPVPNKAGHYMANLPAITDYQLTQAGITAVTQSRLDSHSDPRFYSYRQQTQQQQPFTGRMATLIFMG